MVLPFPSYQVDPYRGLAPHFRVASARARALHAAALGTARVIVASAQALLPRLPRPSRSSPRPWTCGRASRSSRTALADILVNGGYERQDPVDEHGEFSVRGGILDVFPAGEVGADSHRVHRRLGRIDSPLRSRHAAIDRDAGPVSDRAGPRRWTGRSRDGGERARAAASPTLFDYLRASTHVARRRCRAGGRARADREVDRAGPGLVRGAAELTRRRAIVERRAPGELMLSWTGRSTLALGHRASRSSELASRSSPVDEASQRTVHVAAQPAQEFRGRIPDWIADVQQARDRGETILFVASTHGRAERTVELLRDYEIRALLATQGRRARRRRGARRRGPAVPGLPAARRRRCRSTPRPTSSRRSGAARPRSRKRSLAATFLSDLRDLKVGDYIVHVDNGIGQFVGLKQLSVGHGDIVQEFLELRYHGDDKLFVPVERLDLIQKYTGGARRRSIGSAARPGRRPRRRSRRRCATWRRSCSSSTPRAAPSRVTPSSADTHWQEEFEGAFEWDLTPDQATAIADIKRDMESPMPMDRLLCGDVGYGKTEVAMRAAFKAVMDGKQVAVLAPTTVLAFQHLETLKHRFAAFPVRIDMVSRFRTKQEIKEALDAAAAGRLDILVGTHRLLSKDVQFRDLGLLVVDEEQRFGVAHKERIKQMRKKVDVLTMTATPIPRTLNMSLVGIRDMSIIETPPKDRLAIQTNVVKFDPGGDHARDPQRDGARRPDLLRPQPRRVDLLARQPAPAARARSARRRRPRTDERGRARARHARFHGAQVRRAAGDDDRRERPRHPECQHDHHQPRRSLRSRRSCISCAAASAAAIGRPTPIC